MSIVEYKNSGKPRIQRAEAFCTLLEGKIPAKSRSFVEILNYIGSSVRKKFPKVSREAVNNCRGTWYEWLIAFSAWKFCAERSNEFMILVLPSVTTFDVTRLYIPSLFSHIEDFKKKVNEQAGVHLITSNPDFLIVNTTGIQMEQFSISPNMELSKENIENLESAYQYFEHQCSFENILGYLSVKTSLKPDRRLQLAHEGSLMKAIYIHLQTREWIISPSGLKYYAAALEANRADIRGLKTVATHSITSVQSTPQAAVDEVFIINSIEQAEDAFTRILRA